MRISIIAFLLSFIFISCNNTAQFSQEFKDNFTRECVKNAQVNLPVNEAERYCNCVLGIVMTKYNSGIEVDEKMSNMTMKELMDLVEPCQ